LDTNNQEINYFDNKIINFECTFNNPNTLLTSCTE